MRDPRGNTVVTNAYDPAGRVLTQTDALQRVLAFDYTSIADATKVTDPKGNVTVHVFTNGQATSETRGYGTASAATWTYTYDPVTLGTATVTDPNLHTTSYTWDATGNPASTTDALNHTTSRTFNTFGEPLTTTDAKNVTSTNTYDAAGNLLSSSTPCVLPDTTSCGTQTTTYTHGDSTHPGDVTSITDPRTKVWLFGYDAATGDLLSATTPLGDKTTYTYDSAGRRLTMVAPKGNVVGGDPAQYRTAYVPNAFGDVTSVTDPLGHQTQQVYDADRNLHQVIDAETHTTTYDYDVANQLRTITRPDTTTLQNDYWPDGTLKSQTDGASQVTSYDYDELGRLTSMTDPNSRTTHYTHDSAGNLLTALDPASRTTTYSYDVADRLTSMSYSDGTTPNVTYTYDNDDQRLTMIDGTGTTTSAWDSLHRLASQTDGAGQTMAYGYDLAGNLTSMTYPGSKTLTRGYDDAGRLHTVTDWLSHTSTFDYDDNSNLAAQTNANATVGTYGYDRADRLMSIDHAKSGVSFASFGYTRNNNDLLTGVTPTGVGQSNETYGYSPLDQLQTVNGSSYAYDAADNLTGMPSGTNLAYDNANQLCWTAPTTGSCASPPAGATTYSYGSGGERTAMTPPAGNPTVNYAYDQAYRLTEVRGAGYRTSVLASAPLGYWRLGESSGTTVADSAGNARTGTANNVTWAAPSALATDANTAATFSGTATSNVVLPASFDFASSNKFSLEAWVKASSTQTNGAGIINLGYGNGGEQYTLDVNASKYRFFVRNSSGTLTQINSTTGPNNTWQHLVAVFDTTAGRMELWINGKLSGTSTPPASLKAAAANAVIGGRKSSSSDPNYSLALNGSIDEAAIYPRALSAAEIGGHYQAASSNYAGTVAVNGPKAYWRVGETSGTSAADSSTNINTGTYAGGYTLNVTGALAGDSNKAVTFNGTTGYVNAGDQSVGESTNFTAEAWIKGSATTGRYFLSEGSTSTNTPYWGLATDGTTGTKAIFTVRDITGVTATVTGTTSVMDGTWHHVIGVRNGTNFKLYVDGKSDGATTAVLGTITLNATTVGALKRATVSNFFNGSVDEAALYQTALDPTTIARHYRNGTNSTPTLANYAYNGDGTRTSKLVAGTKTNFTWDTAEGLPLLATDGTSEYIYGPGGTPLAKVTGSTVVYNQLDQLGPTRALTDQSGNVVATFNTDAYGNPTASTGTVTTPLQYNGQYRDNETGFYYLRARYYDPATGQLVSRDPANALTRSAYGYVGANPLNAADPTGLSKCGQFSFGGLVDCASKADEIDPEEAVDLVQDTSAWVQAGADVVAVGAAAVGAEPVAAGALAVSEAAGWTNAAATCLEWGLDSGSDGGDCATVIGVNLVTMGVGGFVAPGRRAGSRLTYTRADRVVQGGINLFGDLIGWASGSSIDWHEAPGCEPSSQGLPR